MSETILVTGGTGFLGRHLVEHLVVESAAVRVLDRSPAPAWIDTLGVDYVRADVGDKASLEHALGGITGVVHAAFSPPSRAAEELNATNVLGTRALLDVALAGGRPRVVIVSSTIVDRPVERHPLLADSPLSRLAVYRETRIKAEEEAARAAAAGLSVAMARPKAFLGPGGVGAFAVVFDLVRRGAMVPVAGRGENRYQLCDVRDLARGLVLLLRSSAGGPFSFGSTSFGTVIEDLGAVIAHAGTGARLRTVPGWLAIWILRTVEQVGLTPFSEWHHFSACARDSVVDVTPAIDELGWQPHYSNAEALTGAYDWYCTGAAGYTGSARPVPGAHRALGWIAGQGSRRRSRRPQDGRETISRLGERAASRVLAATRERRPS